MNKETINDLKKAKETIEKLFLLKINEFEEKYGVSVGRIELDKYAVFGNRTQSTRYLKLNVVIL